MTDRYRAGSTKAVRQPFRRDIQGLRAVAIGLVVLYHADIPFLPGGFVGVDVFFVISGFLITNHLLANLDNDGRVQFRDFYARRIRRILPASFVVLVGSLALGTFLLPRLQHEAMLRDAFAAALYFPNLLFARDRTDYLADTTPSLVQHYWSLGVEEQFYLVWPALMFVGFLILGRSKKRLFWMVAGLVVISFAACVYLTFRSQPWAFFSMPTRFWELGVGGLVAFSVGKIVSIPIAVAAGGGWFGLAGILAAGVLFNDQTLFPGYVVALPVLATAAVIFFGTMPTRLGPGSALGARGMVFIGAISYSLYLVHWPLLLLAEQGGGIGTILSPLAKLGLAVAAVPIAYLLYRLVERPFQQSPGIRRRPILVIVSAAALSGLIAVVFAGGMRVAAQTPLDAGRDAAGAAPATLPVFTGYVPNNLQPALRKVSGDNPTIYLDGCHVDNIVTESLGCQYGNADAPIDVVLFGDSHAAQWFPALNALADDGALRLRVETKSACPSVAMSVLLYDAPYVACDEWRASVIAELNEVRPDLIIISNYGHGYALTDVAREAWVDALASTIGQLDEAGVVMVLADTPHFPSMRALCLSAHLDDTEACASSRDDALEAQLASKESEVTIAHGSMYVDLNNYICSDSICGPIIGNTLVYRDANHLTATFAETLSGPLGDAIYGALATVISASG